jgi:hypothetical protein
MKKLLTIASALFLFQTASLAQADFSFNVNVGGPPVVVTQPPEFIYPPELGYGVAVGLPYDMFYISGIYYLYRGGGWFRSPDGLSWIQMRHRELPPDLRRYKIGRIRQFRDREYRVYSRDPGHYQGRHFRPGGEERHEMRGPGHEGRPGMGERHDMREQRQDMREQRPDEHMRRGPEGERGGEGRERER